jgi:hypothetical protein
MQRLIWILWPSFVVAGVAEAVFFTLVDPQELYLFGEAVHYSRLATYSIGFFAFWAVCAASSAFTCFLQGTVAREELGSVRARRIIPAFRNKRTDPRPPSAPARRRSAAGRG